MEPCALVHYSDEFSVPGGYEITTRLFVGMSADMAQRQENDMIEGRARKSGESGSCRYMIQFASHMYMGTAFW